MLPGIDGLSVCRSLRERGGTVTPILMLTARDQIDDKLLGFAAGADDYLIKPFSIRELEARLKALVNRHERQSTSGTVNLGPLQFDPGTLRAEREGVVLDLNPIQRRLLEVLMRNSHRVVTRSELEHEVWGDNPPDKDILRTHIYALRNVIDKPFTDKLLHTVHGTGYRLSESADSRK